MSSQWLGEVVKAIQNGSIDDKLIHAVADVDPAWREQQPPEVRSLINMIEGMYWVEEHEHPLGHGG